MTETLYSIRDLNFGYKLGEQWLTALQGVNLEIPRGRLVCLAGPSGSGKSTLLNVLGLIEPVQDGDIVFLGESLKGLGESRKNVIRRQKIGFVFQSFQLFPVMNAWENVEYFLTRQGVASAERKLRVEESLVSVGLQDHFKKRPLEMSGGQRQRVAIARALAKRPDVIIADEPTASLDQKTGQSIMEIFAHLNSERGVSVVASSHDPMVLKFCNEHIRLRDGQVVAAGAPAPVAVAQATEEAL